MTSENRVHEPQVSKIVRFASRAAGYALTSPIGSWVTGTMMQAENAHVSESMLDPATPAAELYLQLNHLAELHQRWSSMGVGFAQILIGGVLALDAIAVDKKKPLTIGGTIVEAVTTMAAMTTPVLLSEIATTIQNAIELEHVGTTLGEIGVLALGAYKIGSAVSRLVKSYKQNKSDHENVTEQVNAKGKKWVTRKIDRDPAQIVEKLSNLKKRTTLLDRRARFVRENNYTHDLEPANKAKVEQIVTEIKETPELDPAFTPLILDVLLRERNDSKRKGQSHAQDSADSPTFLRKRR